MFEGRVGIAPTEEQVRQQGMRIGMTWIQSESPAQLLGRFLYSPILLERERVIHR